jgi:Ca2+-binding RTX toxin-like protein
VKIVPRGVELLDYTEGGVDVDPVAAATDQGAADEIHGEGGDDTIYGQRGNDVLFGDAQSDDIIGGTGNDWISGGTGVDGVIGDDGRIMTSRNSTVFGESLYGIEMLEAVDVEISDPDQEALRTVIDRDQLLVKSVNLTPFSTNPANPNDQYWRATNASDIIFGGWGSDFLHGGVGSDAISGAEALPLEARPQDQFGNIISFDTPFNPGTTAAVNETRFDFVNFPAVHVVYLPLLELNQPRGVISFNANNQVTFEEGNNPFFLNFDHTEGQLDIRSEGGLLSDGDDRIFGSIGNDILFGGTGRDSIYGGYGNDLISADDDLTTVGVDNGATTDIDEGQLAGLNDLPDEDISYEDFVFGGAGRDFMIANTSGDRLVDWNGDFNEYFIPYRNAGAPTVISSYTQSLGEYIVQVAISDGLDRTRANDVDLTLAADGTPASDFGEPYGELGLVTNDPSNAVNLVEFGKQNGVGVFSGRGAVNDGVVFIPDPVPTGDRLARGELDNYGFTPTLDAVTGIYIGDETTINAPITADTGVDRPGKETITTFVQNATVTIGASANGFTLDGPAQNYIYDEANNVFVPTGPSTPEAEVANSVLQLFDSTGELFAYVDQFGGVWIIDDIDDNPNGQRDRVAPANAEDAIEDDWLLEVTVASNGAAAVALPFRSLRNEEQ